MENIRNFSIIAHIDHGKSTLADRFLELTNTVEKRKMQEQYLDQMELERERGITIKMQPVRMQYKNYVLNLIDTPGHIDFSYEVSRALRAVEGAILLVDATRGIQAQTLSNLHQAREAGLTIIPAISKIDSPLARIKEVETELAELLNIKAGEILLVSGKTGEGVEKLLETVIDKVPPPKINLTDTFRSLVFDFKYSNHRGVVVFLRVFSGKVSKKDKLKFKVAGQEFQALEVGILSPEEKEISELKAGEIGYIVTGIKEPGIASVGDTVASVIDLNPPMPGYEKVHPVVWASVYPESQDDFTNLRQALMKLRLSDSALSFEEETSGILGRGFRVGFLGMLHLEIVTERLRREFNLSLVITLPSITYKVIYKNGNQDLIYTPSFFPDDHLVAQVVEPWIEATIIVPPDYTGTVMKLLHEFESEMGMTENIGPRTALKFKMPLRELMRGLFDKLKSATSGFGSISYVPSGERPASVSRLDVLVADEVVPAFAKVVSKRQLEVEAEAIVEKLVAVMPRQMFTTKIQAKALGRIISSRTLSGMRKDVTQHMYGGDVTRKMKLREKQKKGKKKMKERGKVNIPQEVFLKIIHS